MIRVLPVIVVLASCGKQPPYQEPTARNPAPDPTAEAPATRSKYAAKPPHGTRTSDLPDAARAEIRAVMFEHGLNMESLLWSVLMIQYDTTLEISEWLVAQSKTVSAPGPAAKFPPAFYRLRSDMADAAGALARAAKAHDDDGIAAAYGRLSETCVRCHTRYLWSKKAEP